MKALRWFAVAGVALVLATSASAGSAADDGRIAFAAAGKGGNVDVYAIDANGRNSRRLTEHAGFDACAAYSPSGRQIAFCSDRSGSYQVWLMSAAGSGERQLTKSPYPALFPAFSPDGRRIVFEANDGGPAAEDIFVVAAAGGKIRRLTGAPGADTAPHSRPTGAGSPSSRTAKASRRSGSCGRATAATSGG